ncbi:MAG: hypothetical protein HRU09_16220 [Oligoflexales bacterium]|nr:hypothetical protein [Oligoflexales bacterium]
MQKYDQFKDWILNEGKRCNSAHEFLNQLICRLNEYGMEIQRSLTSILLCILKWEPSLINGAMN